MKPEFLKEVVRDTLKQIEDVLAVKSTEYVRNNDAMHNFNVGARITGKSREKVLYGFALKHEISIKDMRDDVEKGLLPSEELVNEKYGDMINYLILEKASILEKIKEKESRKLSS